MCIISQTWLSVLCNLKLSCKTHVVHLNSSHEMGHNSQTQENIFLIHSVQCKDPFFDIILGCNNFLKTCFVKSVLANFKQDLFSS